MGYIKGLPSGKPIRVRVRLDDKPFESFPLDLSSEPRHHYCLGLYPGYWHWIDAVWDAKKGCTCGEPPKAATPKRKSGT
jgi:hypothetical protein